jgi:phosphoserine aminotransferase
LEVSILQMNLGQNCEGIISLLIGFLGIRASNYNAITESGVEKLVAYIKEFAAA